MTEREQLEQLVAAVSPQPAQPKADPQAEAIRALLTAAWPYLWTYLPVILPMLLNMLAGSLAAQKPAKAAEFSVLPQSQTRFGMNPLTLPGLVGLVFSYLFWKNGLMTTDIFTAASVASGSALAPTIKKNG